MNGWRKIGCIGEKRGENFFGFFVPADGIEIPAMVGKNGIQAAFVADHLRKWNGLPSLYLKAPVDIPCPIEGHIQVPIEISLHINVWQMNQINQLMIIGENGSVISGPV